MNNLFLNLLLFYIIENKFYKINSFISIISFILFNLFINNYYILLINFIYFGFLRGNIQSLLYAIKLKNTLFESQQPTPYYLINEINLMIKKHTPKNFKKLIDFGCGECHTLNQINFKYKKIGVEYNNQIYKNAIRISSKNNYNIYKIINCNILDYKFTDNSVIYMYEPLWDVENNDVYIKLFQILDSFNYNIDIIYVTGLFVKKLDHHFFNKYNFEIIDKKNIGSLFLNRDIYYCKKKYNIKI